MPPTVHFVLLFVKFAMFVLLSGEVSCHLVWYVEITQVRVFRCLQGRNIYRDESYCKAGIAWVKVFRITPDFWILRLTFHRTRVVNLGTTTDHKYVSASPLADLGPNTLKSIQIHYNYFDLSMITITLQLQDL